jgi:hypothetical protein
MRIWNLQVRDVILGAALLVLLALPFVPVPGDHDTLMRVHFRAGEGAKLHAFSLPTSESVCTVVQAAIDDNDPQTGAFTRVSC